MFNLNHTLAGMIVLLFALLLPMQSMAEYDSWPYIKKNLFAERAIEVVQSNVRLYAPELAADASVVPVSIKLAPQIIQDVSKLFLIIDRNPDPYAMEIKFSPLFRATGSAHERNINTRVRVNNFSTVRAIIETMDGTLYMDQGFVAGSGGCSLPPASNQSEALKKKGMIKTRILPEPNISLHWKEAIVRIRHPNYTGMQPSVEEEEGFIPANYINQVEVLYGDEVLMTINAGITLSENPSFRFNFSHEYEKTLHVIAVDSEDKRYSN